LKEQRDKNEPVYIKIDMENENQANRVEEIIFKVSPGGKVERHHVSPYNDSLSQVEEQRTAIGFHPKGTTKEY
jgi:hypothetical protein